MITFDHAKLERLKDAHAKAVANKAETFRLDGHDFVTVYAEHLIKFVELALENEKN